MRRFKSFMLAVMMMIGVSVHGQDVPTQVSANTNSFSIGNNNLQALQNSVNLLTGSVSFPMGLTDVGQVGGMPYSISLNYSSEVKQQVETWNKELPTGPVGLGWSFDYPKIIVDNKSTGNRHDDDFYIVNNGINSSLIKIADGSRFIADKDRSYDAEEFVTKDHTNWRLFYINTLERWEILTDDGSLMIFGGKEIYPTAVQWVVHWGNWIGNSSSTINQSKQAMEWDLAKVQNQWGDWVELTYLKEENRVSDDALFGKYHTEASYLESVENSFGSIVRLFYGDKFDYEYYEPHTEQTEPDAYQERYEKKYLSRVEFRNHNDKLLEKVHLVYDVVDYRTDGHTTDYMRKRRLIQIYRENDWNEHSGDVYFDYVSDGILKGTLKTVRLKSGTQITFNYKTSGHIVGNSLLQKLVTAPSGYSHPKVWHAGAFSVVTWRNDVTDEVKVFGYIWNGRWEEQELFTIEDVRLNPPAIDDNQYQDFQFVTGKNFFAIVSEASGDHYLYYAFIDEHKKDKWITTPEIPLTSSDQYLISGEDFFATYRRSTGQTRIYDYHGNDFHTKNLNFADGTYYGTASNNYIFLSDQDAGRIRLIYKNQLGVWVTKEVDSAYEHTTTSPSIFSGANSSVVGLLGHDDHQEAIFSWDTDYNINKKHNIGFFENLFSRVEHYGNDLVMVKSTGGFGTARFVAARFDGKTWQLLNRSVFAREMSLGENVVSFGYLNFSQYVHYRASYDANNRTWGPDVALPLFTDPPGDFPSPFSHANFPNSGFIWPYFLSKDSYGNWSTLGTTASLSDNTSNRFQYITGPDYLYHKGSATTSVFYKMINGQPKQQTVDVGRHTGDVRYYRGGAHTFQTFNHSNPRYATSLELHRIDGASVEGNRKDYPVSFVTYHDGFQDYQTSYTFDPFKAKFDPLGNTVRYEKSAVYQGTASHSMANGHTEYMFFNGNAVTEDNDYTNQADYYGLMSGQQRSVKHFDHAGNEVSSTATDYTYYQSFSTLATSRVVPHGYVVGRRTTSMLDGIYQENMVEYHVPTGKPKLTRETTPNNTRGEDIRETQIKYSWEVYPGVDMPTTPVQRKTIVNGHVVHSEAVVWQSWGGVWAPWKTYVWEGTGTSDFSAWGGSDPSSDWRKTAEVAGYNLHGLREGQMDVDQDVSSAYRDYAGYLTLLSVSNAQHDEIMADDFNRDDLFHPDLNWSNENNKWSIFNDVVGVRDNSNAKLMLSKAFNSLKTNFIAEYRYRIVDGSPSSYTSFLMNESVQLGIHGSTSAQTWGGGLELMFFQDGSYELNSANGILASGVVPGSTSDWHIVRVVRAGNDHHVYVDSDRIISLNSAGGIGPFFGFANHGGSSEIDDFRLYPADAYASYTAYNDDFQYPEKVIDGTGLERRTLINRHKQPVASINERGVPIETNMGSSSEFRQGAFVKSDPNLILTTIAKGDKGYAQAFDEDPAGWSINALANRTTFLVSDGFLKISSAGGNSGNSRDGYELNLPEAISGRVGIEFDVFLNGNSNNFTFGFGAGDLASDIQTTNSLASFAAFDGNEVWKYFSTSWQTITDQLNPQRLHRIKLVLDTDSKTSAYYLDGKELTIDVPFVKNAIGDIQYLAFFNYGKGVAVDWYIDNLVVYQDPSHLMAYYDAGGKVRQKINEVAEGKIEVSEDFYDELGRNYAKTKRARLNSTSLNYRSGFVLDGFDGTSLSGEITTIYDPFAFYASRFEDSPLKRVMEKGMPSADYQIGSNTTRHLFDKNELISSSPYYMGSEYATGEYFAEFSEDADGGQSISFKDHWGRTIMTKRGKSEIATDGRVASTFILTTELSSGTPLISSGSLTAAGGGEASYTIFSETSGSPVTFKIGTVAGAHDVLLTSNGTGTVELERGKTYHLTLEGGPAGLNFNYISAVNPTVINDYTTTAYEYDAKGRLYKTYSPNYFHAPPGSDPDAFVTEVRYDHFGQAIYRHTPDAGVSTIMYDKAGRKLFQQDQKGATNGYVFYWKYDELDRISEEGYWYTSWASLLPSSVVPGSAIWKKRYYYHDFTSKTYLRTLLSKVEVNNDEDGVTDVQETYEYDDLGRLVTSKQWVYAYQATPEVIHYKYNHTGQLVEEDYGSGTPSILYTYHSEDGSLQSIGVAGDPDKFAYYEYGLDGAVSTVAYNNRTLLTALTYDQLGRLKEMEDPYFKEELRYEAEGASPGYFTAKIAETGFSFKPDSWGPNPRPDNYTYTYSYNNLGMLLSADHATDNRHDVGIGGAINYDANGNISSMRRGGITNQYQYYRGTNKVRNTEGNDVDRFLYDEIGNVSGKDVTGVEVVGGSINLDTYSGNSYQLTTDNSKVRLTSGFRFNSEQSGRFEIGQNPSSGGLALAYDPYINRTTSISQSEAFELDLGYGVDDNRVYKENRELPSNTVRKMMYVRGSGLSPGLVKVKEPNGTEHQTFFIYGPDGAIATFQNDQYSYHIKDHTGSTRLMVNESGAVTNWYNYRPFGGLIDSYTGISNNYLFQGQEKDPRTGLYNFNARLYDEDLGRFLATDPKDQFHSPYLGIGNNPVMMIDPDGEWVLSALKIASGIGPVLNLASAVTESVQFNNPLKGLAVFTSSFLANTLGDFGSIGLGVANITNSIFTSSYALLRGDVKGAQNALRAGFLAPIDADIATFKNGGIRGLAASGVNSSTASVNAIQLGWNRAFGGGSYWYHGRIGIGNDGHQALLWSRRNAGGNPAKVFGNSITLRRGYYEIRGTVGFIDINTRATSRTEQERRQALFLHETIHIRQQKWLGTGGQIVRFFERINDPEPNYVWYHPSNMTIDKLREYAIERYGRGSAVNPLEIQAEAEEILFRDSDFYWEGIPVFY